MQTLNIIRPDDWHIHLRHGAWLPRTVADATRYCARALVMPNLDPPISTVKQALAYRNDILASVPENVHFEPLMALYLLEDTDLKEIKRASESDIALAFKFYPAHATTASMHGIKNIENIYPMLEQMQKHNVVFSVHAESPEPEVDIFDRESHFIQQRLVPIIKQFPALRIVIEHISTAVATEFVRSCKEHIVATITAHHLLYTRNDLLANNLRPHYYCAPILKHSDDRKALCLAATSGSPQFFMGTDSAPHRREDKQSACGCAGCYTALSALSDYALIFEQHQALNHLEHFTSCAGADFYGLARNTDSITLSKTPWQIPQTVDIQGAQIVPLGAGLSRDWQIVDPPHAVI